MPNIAEFHPQIVHFVIAGAALGILFRWVSLTGKLTWTDGAATALIVIGAVAAWFAVRSGVDAHGIPERIPGAVQMVQHHEEEGIELRNILLWLAAIELVLLLPRVAPARKLGRIAAAVLGLWAGWLIYETGEAGGKLVYSYAGGVGTRSGDSTDVNNLLKAGLYHRAVLSRTQQNDTGAALAFAELAARFPDDATAQIMGAESLMLDTKDFAGARVALSRMVVPADTARNYRRYTLAWADVYIGLGHRDSARALLEPLLSNAPTNKALLDRMEKVK